MEERGFSIFMLIFAGALLLYGGIMAATGEENLLPYRIMKTMKRVKDQKAYVRNLGRIVMLTGIGIAIGAAVSFFAPPLVTGIVFVAAVVISIIIGVKTTPPGIDKGIDE